MTTTTDKMRARVIALVAKARATEFDGERELFIQKARDLVTKYSLSPALLTDPTPQAPSAARQPGGYTPPERKYPCRFGCSPYVQHTIDEMNACAERRRRETGSETAYDIPADHDPNRRGSSFFDDFFREYTGYTKTRWTGQGHRERASYNTGRSTSSRTGSESAAGSSTNRRRQTSHAFCDHENSKAARARCRKEGGPYRPV